MNRTALFPGSFDPFTLGHKIVVDQGLELFERIVIAVGVNTEKRGLLTPENRARLIRDLYRNDSRIEVVIYNELTGKVCRQLGIDTILRGLRNTVDFEYERNIMQVNQTLFPRDQDRAAVHPGQVRRHLVERHPRAGHLRRRSDPADARKHRY